MLLCKWDYITELRLRFIIIHTASASEQNSDRITVRQISIKDRDPERRPRALHSGGPGLKYRPAQKLFWQGFRWFTQSLLANTGTVHRFRPQSLPLIQFPIHYSLSLSGFDSRRCQIFWEVVGLELGPLSLVSTIEQLLGRKHSGSGLENLYYGRRGSAALTTRHPSIRKNLALTSPTSAVARTEATELLFIVIVARAIRRRYINQRSKTSSRN
jgi:hypothetical protein